ncbi:MAG: hypothetical protein AAF532_14675 [Planctomycetota bacterium]
MNRHVVFCGAVACLVVASGGSAMAGGPDDPGGYRPELYRSAKLVFAEDFDYEGPLKAAGKWLVKQETQWNVEDGVLIGTPAPVEYQEKMQAIKDVHDGTRPVVILRETPKELVMRMRLRYDGEHAERSYQQLDFGHHINSFVFFPDRTKLTFKGGKKIFRKGDFFPTNKWADVAVEIRDGKLLIQINDEKELIKHERVTLDVGRPGRQVDFKGLDYGRVLIDWVEVYRGID